MQTGKIDVRTTDNQSPVHGFRIATETMLRLPPHMVERWITARSADGLQIDYFGNDERLLVTEDAWWRDLRTVAPGYVAAFASGGPVGFSCDLTAFSKAHADFFRKCIADRKRDEAFWCKVVGRILCDTPEVTVLQYSDAAFHDVRVLVVTARVRQSCTTVRPVLDPALEYAFDGREASGTFWMEQGAKAEMDLFTATELRFHAQPGAG